MSKWKIGSLVCTLILSANMAWSQGSAKIASEQLVFNFGTIAESDGMASHVFKVKNEGDAPLVITRITVSCGCTRPEWSKEPIAPGQTADVKITYNPKGRPGPFYKTISIYSNGKKGSFNLAIKGNVTPKPAEPVFTYPYAIGKLKLHTKNILYSSIRLDEALGQKINLLNESDQEIKIRLGKTPHYLNAQATDLVLKPGAKSTITLLLHAKEAKRMGRVTTELPIYVKVGKEKEVEGHVTVAANIIDNFTKLSKEAKANAPIAQLSGTLLEFGKLPEKKSFVPLIGGKVTGTFEITNPGKSPLKLYSVTCDDERVDLSGGKKTLKPGETATFKVSVRPKEIKTKLETLINVVCNDPNGPIRLIKVTAYK